MTFVYFWFVCGLISFVLHLVDDWSKGKDTVLRTLVCDLFWSCVLGFYGLIMMLRIGDKVIIKGRKK